MSHILEVSKDVSQCMDDCMECYQTCEEAMTYCLEMGEDHAKPGHINLLRDCSVICLASNNLMLSGSSRSARVCDACAEICEQCAKECDRFGKDKKMQLCAEICRRCAESCRKMARTTSVR